MRYNLRLPTKSRFDCYCTSSKPSAAKAIVVFFHACTIIHKRKRKTIFATCCSHTRDAPIIKMTCQQKKRGTRQHIFSQLEVEVEVRGKFWRGKKRTAAAEEEDGGVGGGGRGGGGGCGVKKGGGGGVELENHSWRTRRKEDGGAYPAPLIYCMIQQKGFSSYFFDRNCKLSLSCSSSLIPASNGQFLAFFVPFVPGVN